MVILLHRSVFLPVGVSNYSDSGPLIPVKVHFTVHKLMREYHLLLLFNYCKDVIFLISVSCGTPESSLTSGRERSFHRRSYNLLQLEWPAWPFDAPRRCGWDPASALKKVGELDLVSHKLSSVIGAGIPFWIADCRLLLCRVGKQSFSSGVSRSWSNPSQGADSMHVAKTGIKDLIVGKELFSLAIRIKTFVYHHAQRKGFGLNSEIRGFYAKLLWRTLWQWHQQ